MGKNWRPFLERTFYELLTGPEVDTQMLAMIQFQQDKRVRSSIFSGDSGAGWALKQKERFFLLTPGLTTHHRRLPEGTGPESMAPRTLPTLQTDPCSLQEWDGSFRVREIWHPS